ncbi:MAG: response regulator [Candidatus Methylacidiphilales bacterium]
MKKAKDLMRPLRVLVVEDDLVNQRVTSANLGGHQITIAGTGAEALDALTHLPRDTSSEHDEDEDGAPHLPDLVLLDLFLPDMTGAEVCTRIRRMTGGAERLPIVAYTASQEPMDSESAMRAGMLACLGKPLKVSELRQVLRSVRPDLAARLMLAPNGVTRAGSGRPGSQMGGARPPSVRIASPLVSPPGMGMSSAAPEWAALKEMLGPQGWAEAVKIFQDDGGQYMKEIAAAADQGDWRTLAASAHKLAGCAGSLQQKDLKNQAARLERQCRGPAPALARNLLQELKAQWLVSTHHLR